MANRYDIPASGPSMAFQPFKMNTEILGKALLSRQQSFDTLSAGLGEAKTSFAGLTASEERDNRYLINKQKELDDFVNSLEGQDLTRVPNLQQQITAFSTDPNLKIIEYNNAQNKALQETREEYIKDEKFSPANMGPISALKSEYNSEDLPPEMVNYPTLTPEYNVREELLESGKLFKSIINSALKTRGDGTRYLETTKNLTSEDIQYRLQSSLSDKAYKQLLLNYEYGSEKELYEDFATYALSQIEKVVPIFRVDETTKSSIDWSESDITGDPKNEIIIGNTSYDISMTGAGKAFTLDYMPGINYDAPIPVQFDKIKTNKEKNLETVRTSLKDLDAVPAPGAETIPFSFFNTDTKNFEEGELYTGYVNSKGEDVTAEYMQLKTSEQALDSEITTMQLTREDIEKATYDEMLELNPGAKGRLDQIVSGEINLSESYKTLYEQGLTNAVQKAYGEGATYSRMEDGTLIITRRSAKEGATIGDPIKVYQKDEKFESLMNSADNFVVKKAPLLSQYRSIYRENFKDAFTREVLTGSIALFDVGDSDYSGLVSTINNNLESLIVWDNITGRKDGGMPFMKTVSDGNLPGNTGDAAAYQLLPAGVGYNPLLGKWLVESNVVGLDDKGQIIPGDKSNQAFSLDISSLHEAIMVSMYGGNAEDVDYFANRLIAAFEESGTDRAVIPLPVGEEFTNLTVYHNPESDTYTGTYYDPIENKYKMVTQNSLLEFSSLVSNYNIQNTKFNEETRRANQQKLSTHIQKWGVDEETLEEILVLVNHESHFNPRATNGKTAGIFQFYPDGSDSKGAYKTMKNEKGEEQKYYIDDIANKTLHQQANLWWNIYLRPFKDDIARWQAEYPGTRGAYILANAAPAFLDYSPDSNLWDTLMELKETHPEMAPEVYAPANPIFGAEFTKGRLAKMSSEQLKELLSQFTVGYVAEEAYSRYTK